MKPSKGESAPYASSSRSLSSRDVGSIRSSASTSSGRSPARSTSRPPCGAISRGSVAVGLGGHPADPADVRLAVLFREPEPFRQVLAHLVPVEPLDLATAALELGADDLGDRGLAGAGEPGEPERKAGRVSGPSA